MLLPEQADKLGHLLSEVQKVMEDFPIEPLHTYSPASQDQLSSMQETVSAIHDGYMRVIGSPIIQVQPEKSNKRKGGKDKGKGVRCSKKARLSDTPPAPAAQPPAPPSPSSRPSSAPPTPQPDPRLQTQLNRPVNQEDEVEERLRTILKVECTFVPDGEMVWSCYNIDRDVDRKSDEDRALQFALCGMEPMPDADPSERWVSFPSLLYS
jgi:hypothetical protein